MRRGDVIVVAIPGETARPALVIQSDLFDDGHPSVTVLPITGTLISAPLFRITVEPSPQNGLSVVSQVMADKLLTLRRAGLPEPIGTLEDEVMVRVGRALALWTGIAS